MKNLNPDYKKIIEEIRDKWVEHNSIRDKLLLKEFQKHIALSLALNPNQSFRSDWYEVPLRDYAENDIIEKGQSILTKEQKENLINTGKI